MKSKSCINFLIINVLYMIISVMYFYMGSNIEVNYLRNYTFLEYTVIILIVNKKLRKLWAKNKRKTNKKKKRRELQRIVFYVSFSSLIVSRSTFDLPLIHPAFPQPTCVLAWQYIKSKMGIREIFVPVTLRINAARATNL